MYFGLVLQMSLAGVLLEAGTRVPVTINFVYTYNFYKLNSSTAHKTNDTKNRLQKVNGNPSKMSTQHK